MQPLGYQPIYNVTRAPHFGRESGGAVEEDQDLRHDVRHSPVRSRLVTEHVHGHAGVAIELVEEELVGVDCRDVVGLERSGPNVDMA